MTTETSVSAPPGDTIKQPIGSVFGERPVDTVNPLNNTHARLKQPVSTIFGEGNTIGSPDNKSTNVVLDADGRPRLVLNHQQHGYTESTDLTVVRQPITTRFGDPMVRQQAIPELPVPPAKYTGHPKPAPPLPKTFKKQDKEFTEF